MAGSDDLSPLEMSVALMFGIYMQHKGSDETLSKQEFGALIKKELPAFSQGSDPDLVFKSVDMNQDGSVEFKEFALLVATYATANYEILQDLLKSAEQKQKK